MVDFKDAFRNPSIGAILVGALVLWILIYLLFGPFEWMDNVFNLRNLLGGN